MAYIEIPETALDKNSGATEATFVQIARNFVAHESRLLGLEQFLGAEIWTAKTSDYTLLNTDVNGNYGFNNDGASGQVTLTLPSAVSGMKVVFANIEDKIFTITAASGDTFIGDGLGGAITEVTNVTKGSIIILYCMNDTEWVTLRNGTWLGSGLGTFGGGSNTGGTKITTVKTVQIASAVVNNSFGTLTVARDDHGSCASLLRAIWACGDTGAGSSVIDYMSFATGGAATDFGNVSGNTTATGQETSATSNSTIGIIHLGNEGGGGDTTTNNKIVIASTDSVAGWGALNTTRKATGAVSDGTKGIFISGEDGANAVDAMDYVLFASSAAGVAFGNLSTSPRFWGGSGDNATHGVYGGGITTGTTSVTRIDRITLSTSDSEASFGTLITARMCSGASSGTRAIFGAGSTDTNDGTGLTSVEMISLDSNTLATSFASFSSAMNLQASCSNSHGGLNG